MAWEWTYNVADTISVPAGKVRESTPPRARQNDTPRVSVVIPVFNSSDLVADTVQETRQVLENTDFSFEVILVDDGSQDDSWAVIAGLARHHDDVVAMRLLRNYGQHNANLAGFRISRGEWIVTMDDDGQNPPTAIPAMLATAIDGDHDVVFGRFDRKKASGLRALGSRAIGLMNRRLFGQPPDLVVSNHRVLHREVVDRICSDASRYPYITGQALLYSASPVNVDVEHRARREGASSYTVRRILQLVLRILFSYSLAPLHIAAIAGGLIAILSFMAGGFYLAKGMIAGTNVPGWTTIVVLLAFFQGVTLVILAMLGEYVVRTLNQVSSRPTYHVAKVIE